MSDARHIGDVLAELVRKKRLGRSARSKTARAARAWAAAAGEPHCEHSRVERLHRGVLTVTVDSASCRQELEGFLKDDILAKVRAAGCKFVKDVRFRLADFSEETQ